MFEFKSLKRFPFVILVSVCMLIINIMSVNAVTGGFRGVNWADTRDNFVTGCLYLSGLSDSDTYSSAYTVGDRVVSEFVSKLGSNTVRMPVNEVTVSSWWSVYTGAIDAALAKGNVFICYWAAGAAFGQIRDMNGFWSMWSTIVNKYGNNSNAYFEVINEPAYYSATDLCNIYNDFLTRYPSIPKGRVVLDGQYSANNVVPVGADSRLNGCLLAAHLYGFSVTHYTEAEWEQNLRDEVGNYADRTIVTEYGAPMYLGSNYNYNVAATGQNADTNFIAYIRGMTNQLHNWGMGSCYWPGLRDNDYYAIMQKTGSGSSITLSITNSSGFDRIKYGWNVGATSTTTTSTGTCTPTAIIPYIQVNGGTWQNVSAVSVSSGATVIIGPQPLSGGTWSWSGCNTSGSAREQTTYPTSSCTVIATYTNDCGAKSSQSFTITVSGTTTSTATTTSTSVTKGDVNSNGVVDIVDALLIAQYYVGLNPANFNSAAADVNCSGSIDIVDALLVAQRYVGLISSFPC